MMTAPSIIIPKSIAPKLMRFASTLKSLIRLSAKSSENGITEATTKPDRQFPSNTTTTKITMRQPRMRFSATVNEVLPTRSLRSKNGFK